ncbi:hypothetical protein [Novosphingobium malaysiense]|uniref:Uncharacterized protein n=1 Tax=Novosphingobium malaysiense TaxID=1348853 RepID=A0A0B1ZQX9_9SPHN|nr:hypothetical protein [Novosphingobium malaysiense]KHK93565.1 hypothetical protein LK12_04795 [Novosphingobium malaysiense]
MPKAFDLLAAAAAFARETGVPINDEDLVPKFVADAAAQLRAALGDTALIHGTRTENLFEAMVLSLGRFKLFKAEDVGRVHATAPLRAPDFRIVLHDGEQWLIEVKNVRQENPHKQQTTMSAAYLESLQAYADVVGVPLRIAIYWSRWNIWTLIAPDRFGTAAGGLKVRMPQAIMASELARLGDVSISTVSPLRLVLGADLNKPSSLGSDDVANFTIESARLFSGEVELTDEKDRQLAEMLLLFGEWPIEGLYPVMDGDVLVGVEFVSVPEEPSGIGFDSIGWASRIFSRFFAESTVKGDQVIQLSRGPAPERFAPLGSWDFAGSNLPLWLFQLQPSTAEDSSK